MSRSWHHYCVFAKAFFRPGDSVAWSPPTPSDLAHQPDVLGRSNVSSPLSPHLHRTLSSNGPEGESAYHDFLKLVNFMSDYLSPTLTLHDEYVHAKRKRVSFENLWMLFDVGDVVYSPSKKEGSKRESTKPFMSKASEVYISTPQVFSPCVHMQVLTLHRLDRGGHLLISK